MLISPRNSPLSQSTSAGSLEEGREDARVSLLWHLSSSPGQQARCGVPAPAKPILGMVPTWSRRFAPEPQAVRISHCQPSPGASRALPLIWADVHNQLAHLREALSAPLQLGRNQLWDRGPGCLTAEGNRERSSEPATSQGQEGNREILQPHNPGELCPSYQHRSGSQ